MKLFLFLFVILFSAMTCYASTEKSSQGLWDWATALFTNKERVLALDINATLLCVPGTVFIYDHNVCFCDDPGTKVTCKRKMLSMLAPQLHRNQLQNITIDCNPGEYFERPCYECICHTSGKFASCVYKQCLKTEKTDTRDKCTPGSVFNERCNACICGSNGTAACTTLGCGLEYWNDNSTKCVPSSSLMVGCNDCFCNKNGLKLTCNKMGCEPMSFYHENILNITMNCEANKTFDYNCHQCICDEHGKYAMCSGKQCPHKYHFVEVKDTIEDCNPGMIFSNKCNVCICDKNRKGTCTTLSCKMPYEFVYVDDLNFIRPELT